MHFNINKDRAVCAPARALVSNRGQGLAQREDSLVTTLKPFDIISSKTDILPKLGYGLFWLALFVASLGFGQRASAALAPQCDNTITASVVVLDNPTIFNRLGAQNPNWMMYALKRDVVHKSSASSGKGGQACELPGGTDNGCQAGEVELRRDKRPRPLVVRSVEGACLTVEFTNLLAPVANPNNAINDNPAPFQGTDNILINNDQVAGRCAGFHATGTELLNGMEDDGSMVGKNPGADIDAQVGPNQNNCGDGLAAPDETRIYELYTPHEGAYIINSYGATIGSEQSGGNLGIGLFGALNVQPKGARLYRSQVTEEEMRLATTGFVNGPGSQPIIDYDALYPNVEPWISEGKAGLPVLRMVTGNDGRSGQLVHSDINAIIAGPDADGTWRSVCNGSEGSPAPDCPYPLESVGKNNPQLPNRIEAFREFSSIFHDEQTNTQVFPKWYGDPVLGYTLDGVGDAFMINYGSGGIGSEIIANRLHAGPMHDCTDCAYEEFFLASQTVGDPALLVKHPANTGIEQCDPRDILSPNCWRQFDTDGDGVGDVGANPPIPGNEALYQEDPSNVHHAYVGDYTKIRNIHAGAFEQHIFHLHNQQWLFNPNDDNANYLDAQEIMPGSGHTYELVNGGAGNRNKTSGDAIFHCHFYPHFAQGMWYHIRIMDTFQRGTVLAASGSVDPQNPPAFDPSNPGVGIHGSTWGLKSGKPAQGARALPDGELPDGSPIPAIVPLPGKPMAPMPAKVSVAAVDRGDFGVLSGRRGPNGLGQGPDSSQAIIDLASMAGPDGNLFTGDDVSPGFPFHLAGNNCGFARDADGNPIGNATGGAAGAGLDCPEGTVGQRMPTPVLDLLTEEGAADPSMPADWAKLGGGWDGGLPRHNLRGYTSGGLSLDTQNRLDFRKIIKSAAPVYYPETGTEAEKVAMAMHAVRTHPSHANLMGSTDTKEGNFLLNGSPAVPGGPFQDPCIDDQGDFARSGESHDWYDGQGSSAGNVDTKGNALGTKGGSPYGADNPRTYKIANVQIDAVFNKVGHHYSQERIIALWEDVDPLINKQRPPEPLVMRFNTFDCGKILHANLVPAEFEVDDFQVRTPTDIIGQHIHLPKWDLTTNDGAANGWNYEDGTLSPLMVQERIAAINNYHALLALPTTNLTDILVNVLGLTPGVDFHADLEEPLKSHIVDMTGLEPVPTIPTGDPHVDAIRTAGTTTLTAEEHPFFGKGQMVNGHYEYKGARTTIQRILVDPVMNVAGVDRGLGLTFSHDHYGPSTFQQIGLYSTILAEPAGSNWYHNESGEQLNTRPDGGPTTWQAAIITGDDTGYNVACDEYGNCGDGVGGAGVPSHREFYFEMSDFQHAYNAGTYVAAGPDGRPLPAEFGDKIKQIYRVRQPNYFDATEAYADTINGTWAETVNPTLKLEAHQFPDVVTAKGACPGGPLGAPTNFDVNVPRPCAEAINIGHSSTWVINYRNEPVGLRVFDPGATGPDGKIGAQTDGMAGDLAFALQSRTDRAIGDLNTSFGNTPYPAGSASNALGENINGGGPAYCSDPEFGDGINCDRMPGDPYTPIMRAFERDQVKIKIQVGATEEQHQTTIHGVKWLSNGSGFGRSPNSGWRNFQSHGISEQFSLQVPVTRDPDQKGNHTDYLYATDATRPGMWLGTWGVLRAYRNPPKDLVELPDNPLVASAIANEDAFIGVCEADPNSGGGRGKNKSPKVPKNLVSYDVTAVLANDVLTKPAGVTIPANLPGTTGLGGDSDGDGIGDNAGGPLDPNGGTLVYNYRDTNVPDVTIVEAGVPQTFAGGDGPLHDPTAILYVRSEDLVFDTTCEDDGDAFDCRTALGDPVGMQDGAPVEPLVLRANAGDCIEVTLRNALPFTVSDVLDPDTGEVIGREKVPTPMPDLSGWQDMMWGVTRRLERAGVNEEMYFFNNNLVRPSSYVGLHAQLVEYDMSRDDGLAVGQNDVEGRQIAAPGEEHTYRWYAGHLSDSFVGETTSGKGKNQRTVRNFAVSATPVEFGASNLLSADRVKQPQKGLFGALSILPAGATYPAALDQVVDGQDGVGTRGTRAQVTVNSPFVYDAYGNVIEGAGGEFREALAMGHKIANIRWKDGRAVKNIHQGELGREGAEDSGQAGFNYGMEPSWFRFQLPPDVPFGNAGTPNSFGSIPNPHAMYSNALVGGLDPVTPVFETTAGMATRMYVLNGASADRDGTFILHGHLWQRDPYVCPGDSYLGLPGYCEPSSIGSLALGKNPVGKYMGGEEGMGHVYGHWPILFNAGGTHEVAGDYLYRDYTPSGNRNGQFGILRVKPN